MATHVVVPADTQPTVLCSWNGGRAPSWSLLEQESVRQADEQRQKFNPRVEWLDSLQPTDRIYAPLGGVGHSFLAGAAARGITDIWRIPYSTIKDLGRRGEVTVPKRLLDVDDKQDERCEHAATIAELVLAGQNEHFHPYNEVDARISLVGVYIDTLVATQDEARKRLQQRSTRLERDQEYFLNLPRTERQILDLRAELIDAGAPLAALLEYEQLLENAIKRQLRGIKVYGEVFEPVKGIGPRLGARILGSIVTIKRFPKWGHLASYGGWSVVETKDNRRVAPSFKRGESANFSPRLRQGLWLFCQQIARSDSQFRWYADRYKQLHEAEIGNLVYTDTKNREFRLTKGWLNRRALRSAAQRLVRYLYHAACELEGIPTRFPFPASNWLEPAKYNLHQPPHVAEN